MQQISFADLKLSRLMLGTVQFGLPYGIANKSGQPSPQEVREILQCAHEGGVNCLDTAAGYGDSEEVLGAALEELGLAEQMIVTSKVIHLADDLSDTQAKRLIEESVTNSLRRLRVKYLPICLFHSEDNYRYLELLARLQEKGLVRHIGVSLSGVDIEQGAQIIEHPLCEAVQLPMSVLDRRYREAGALKNAQRDDVAVFVRSVFLQGLLLMPEEEVLPELAEVLPVLARLRELASAAGMPMEELCTRYVLDQDGITCALTGVDSPVQLRQNIALFNKGPLPPDLQECIEAVVPPLPEKILHPRLWSKRMPDAQVRR